MLCAPTEMIRYPVITVALVVALHADTSMQSAKSREPAVRIDVKGPVVIGFFPPYTRAEQQADDGSISEGLAHVRFALEDIAKCYENKAAVYRLDVTRRIVLRDRNRIHRIDIPRDPGRAVGLVFARPRHEPRTVFAVDGPATLIALGPMTAAEYFGAKGCRNDR